MLERLGPYRIEGVLGEGAMGVVYKAYDPNVDRTVALKTLHKTLPENKREQILARFKVEARSAGRLIHPKIVAVHGFGEEQGIPYIVMEYAPGPTLQDCLDKRVRYDLKTVAHIMLQLLDALDFAHRHHIVHRDISSSNIIVMQDGSIKITDFGIARIDTSYLTNIGDVLGTPNYMSPEQWRGEPLDHRTDIFSAGVIFYQLLVGEKPFAAEDKMAVRQRTIGLKPLPPSKLNPQVPVAFDAIVSKAMAKDPRRRYRSAIEFLAAIRSALGTVGNQADDTTFISWRTPIKRRQAHNGKLLIGISAALMIALGIAMHSGLSKNTPDRGYLRISSHPAGAVALLASGEFIGVTPTHVGFAPGEYEMVLKKDGYHDLQVTVEVESSADIPVDLVLDPVEITLE
ncbi:MAG: protein kinase domain-containing protein [Gammaproteobacteria bacterium]